MPNNLSTVALTKLLIAQPSVTPDDHQCQALISDYLATLGFTCTHLPFGTVKNLWARRGSQAPLFVFLGHTDVVPAGDIAQWHFPPFVATEVDGYLYGRGVADMKSSIAAMMTACQRFITNYPNHKGSIAFLLTSDEEGPATDGIQKVIPYLQNQNINIDWCLVGEPSSDQLLGDTLKVGRRGSLYFSLTLLGKQGHIAYPHLAENAVHHSLPILLSLIAQSWGAENPLFPATALQFSSIHSDGGASNIIPGSLTVKGNFRYAPSVSSEQIMMQFEKVLQQSDKPYQIDWRHSALPFLSQNGALTKACVSAVKKICHREAVLATTGGTSDGRFIAPLGVEVVELGVLNATIHQIDEHVKIADIDQLSELYEDILRQLLLKNELRKD